MKSEGNPLRTFLWVAAIVVGLWFLWGWMIGPVIEPDLANRGLLGDAFGALNTLFAGLAFAGVITALWMQSKELRLQREELRLQREEMKRNREEMIRQGDILRRRADADDRQADAQAAPLFDWDGGKPGPAGGGQTIIIINKGESVTDVGVTCIDELVKVRGGSVDVWEMGKRVPMDLLWAGSPPQRIVLEFAYCDRLQRYRKEHFEHSPLGHFNFRRADG